MTPTRICPVCKSETRALEGGIAPIRLCRTCGHMFAEARPTHDVLAATYATYGYDQVENAPPAFLYPIVRRLIDSFEPHRRTGRLLDVGFGAGTLLEVAQSHGWTTHGVELSPAAVAAGRARGLGTLHEGDFVTLELECESYDVIVMTELIEHLPSPMPFLHKAARLLRPGGLLYLTTPHGRGLSGRLLGASWSVMAPPEHLQLFSASSVRRCLAEAGFANSKVYTQSILPHEIVGMVRRRLRGKGTTLANAPSTEEKDVGRVGRSYQLNAFLVGNPVGRLAKSAANVLIRRSGLGDSLRVAAIR